MVITIKKGMTPNQVQNLLIDAQQMNFKRKRKQKKAVLKQLGGMLSHLKTTPLKIQEEMRDGWLE
jgi:hypothetical protein